MILTDEQSDALKNILHFFGTNHKRKWYYLGGFAGTGKTTLAAEIASSIHGSVLFLAPTGKAASVLQEKGVGRARTIHSAIYDPKGEVTLKSISDKVNDRLDNPIIDNPESFDLYSRARAILDLEIDEESIKERLQRLDLSFTTGARFALKEFPDTKEYSLVIVDECSMIGTRIVEDLLASSHAVLFMGDPHQLPPINAKCFFQNQKPDFLLRDIQRQIDSSPVIQLATMVRQGKRLKPGNYGSSQVMNRPTNGAKLTTKTILGHSQILVGTHKSRHGANWRWRSEAGRASWRPEIDDKLLCKVNDRDRNLLNGTQWKILEVGEGKSQFIAMTVTNGEHIVDITTHQDFFLPKKDPKVFSSDAFTYGYAMTVHSAQGSEWDSVLIIDESSIFRSSASRHLYTAITRARNRVTIVKMS